MPCFGNGRQSQDPESWEVHRPTGRVQAPRGRLPAPAPAPHMPAQHAPQPQSHALQTFTYGELHAATYGFSERRVVGEGGFGKVYWGRLRSGVHVAVKRLDRRGQQGDREFNVEVDMLTRLQHPNLIRLLGVCVEDDHRAAVFELMHGGCLRAALDAGMAAQPITSTAQFLPRHPLCWTARMNAAVGAAAGLAFLHEETRPSILHRDVKSTNILLDEADCACVGDLGLARSAVVPHHHHHHHHRPGPHAHPLNGMADTLNGTFGYLAPEFLLSGKHSHKSDVYAFGVVLLELLTGQQPVDPMRRHAPSLAQHMLPHLGSFDKVQPHLDPVICREPISVPQLVLFLDVTAACLLERPQNRPTMTTVKLKLQEAAEFRDPDPMRLPGRSSMRASGHAAAAQLHSSTIAPERQQPAFQPAVMMSEPLVSPASTPTARLMTDSAQQLFHSPTSQQGMGSFGSQPSPSLSHVQPSCTADADQLSRTQLQQAMPSGQPILDHGTVTQLSQSRVDQSARSGQAASAKDFEEMQLAALHVPPQRPRKAQHLYSKQSAIAGQSGNPWAHQSVPPLIPQSQPVCAWSPVGSGSAPGPPLPSASLDAWAPANLAVS